MTQILFKELSYKIIGAAMEVHRVLGPGFLEAVYEAALAHELTLRDIPFERQLHLTPYVQGPTGRRLCRGPGGRRADHPGAQGGLSADQGTRSPGAPLPRRHRPAPGDPDQFRRRVLATKTHCEIRESATNFGQRELGMNQHEKNNSSNSCNSWQKENTYSSNSCNSWQKENIN
jgi:hypothetical protein